MTIALNEEVLQAGTVSDLSASSTFSVAVVVSRPSIIKGIVVNTVDLTDAVDLFTINVNGAATSPVTTCRGTDGVAANVGEFIGCDQRLAVNSGDRIQVLNGGQSSGTAAVFAAIVIGQ